MRPIIFLTGVFALFASSGFAIVDQEKLYYSGSSYILYWDDVNYNYYHDPQETYYPYVHGSKYGWDMSCWYASACCLMKDEGYGNPYCYGLEDGAAHSPATSPWGTVYYAGGGGDSRTWDDGGWQHWAFDFLDIEYYPFIKSVQEFTPNSWDINPLQWCQDRIQEGHAVGVCLFSGFLNRGSLPSGYRRNMPGYYHAITIWEIDEKAGTLLITDSDDQVYGPRIVDFTYDNWKFSIQDLYPGPDAHINYCVALKTYNKPYYPLNHKMDPSHPKLGMSLWPLKPSRMGNDPYPMMDRLVWERLFMGYRKRSMSRFRGFELLV